MGSILITILLSTTLFFPGMFYSWAAGFSMAETILYCMIGGVLGFFFYGYLGKLLSDWFKANFLKNKKLKKFGRMNRFLVRVRGGYGLLGIALITPVVKNPLGFAIGMTITKSKGKLLLYMAGSMLFWVLLGCSLYFGLGLDIRKLNPF